MKRRQFLLQAAAGAAHLTAAPSNLHAATSTSSTRGSDLLLGATVPALGDLYHRDLFVDWLPFIEQHVVDAEYGGFLCNTDFDGKHTDFEKDSLFEGRGIWIFSMLYSHFGRDTRFLEVARRSVELLANSQPADDALWCTQIHRNGTPAGPPGKLIPTDVGIAEGFAAYAQATGKQEFLDRAKQLMRKAIAAYNRPDYNPAVGRTYFGASTPPFPGAQAMGSRMIMLRSAAQILELDPGDVYFDRFARQCASLVLQQHFNPEYQLNNELLNHDGSRSAAPYDQLVNLGNTLEMTWMLLDEATRQRDDILFRTFAARFQRHTEVAADRVYGGMFHNLLSVAQNQYELNKLLWAQEETLTDALYIYDRLGEPWAAELFGSLHHYVRAHFALASHGSPMWMYASGREVTFEQFLALKPRIENYHHPRHLILCLRRLRSMAAHHRKQRR
jgi:mannose/cellobiose epimerase-like protein (N-acyl-D-glucosamine 2-epimerase family)